MACPKLKKRFAKILADMERDEKEASESTDALSTLASNDLMEWNGNEKVRDDINGWIPRLKGKLEEITNRERKLFECVVAEVRSLESIVGGGGGEDVAEGSGSGGDDVDAAFGADPPFDERCENWCRLRGVLRPDWSDEERDKEFSALSSDWSTLWSLATSLVPLLKTLTTKLPELVEIGEEIRLGCTAALDRVASPDGVVLTILRRRSLLIYSHPGPVTRTDKKGEIRLRMMSSSVPEGTVDGKPEILTVSLVQAHAPIDRGNRMRRKAGGDGGSGGAAAGNGARGGVVKNDDAAHHVLFTLAATGEKECAFSTRTNFRGFEIPFNAKSKLQLKDLKRKKAQGASAMLYRVRFAVKLTKDHLFEYDTLPFAIVTNASQNAEGWISVLWDRAFGGGNGEVSGGGGGGAGGDDRAQMDPHRRIPWSVFFPNLSGFYEALTGRGLQPPASSSLPPSLASYQEDGLLWELKRKRDDSISFHELTTLDFDRQKDQQIVKTSRWQWIYSFIPLLHEKFGEAKKERQELLSLWREGKIWGFVTKSFQHQLLKKCGQAILRFRSSGSGEVVFVYYYQEGRIRPFNWAREELEPKRQFFVDLLIGRVRSVGGQEDEAVLRYPGTFNNGIEEIPIKELSGSLGISRRTPRQLESDDSYISGDVRDEEVLPMVQDLMERLSLAGGSVRSPNSSVAGSGSGGADDDESIRSDETLLPPSTMVVEDCIVYSTIVDQDGLTYLLDAGGTLTPVDASFSQPTAQGQATAVTTIASPRSVSESEDFSAKRSRVTSGYSEAPSTPDSGFNTDASKSFVDASPWPAFSNEMGEIVEETNGGASVGGMGGPSNESDLPGDVEDFLVELSNLPDVGSQVSDLSDVGIYFPDADRMKDGSKDPFMGAL